MTESALYACDRLGMIERSEIKGGSGGVLGAAPDDGKRAYACGPLCWPERSDPLGGVRGGCWADARMTESALYACDRAGLTERSEIWGGVRGGVGTRP